MSQIIVDLMQTIGSVKPMHCVNNGPTPMLNVRSGQSNARYYLDAGIPCVRNHDASQCYYYGAEHTVDVENIFRNFDADENDPSNYDFTYTDFYSKYINECGSSIMYRLGSSIEHGFKKYHTRVPKDYKKYARVCEHIIRHLCYGWADGLHLDIAYWEIWAEPDAFQKYHNPCWQDTWQEFLEFYKTVLLHLKSCFPELMIGSPGFCSSDPDNQYVEDFVRYCRKKELPMDFYSWHHYGPDPQLHKRDGIFSRELLDKYGYTDTKLIVGEWNYMNGRENWDFDTALLTEHNEKGAAYCAASILSAQDSPIDMFTYYDARPGCIMNGIFDSLTLKPLKPYYAFWQFGQLYKLENSVEAASDNSDIYVGAAAKNGKAAIQVAYYSDDEKPDQDVEICIQNLPGKCEVRCLMTDAAHTNELIRKDVFAGEQGSIFMKLPLQCALLLQVEPVA